MPFSSWRTPMNSTAFSTRLGMTGCRAVEFFELARSESGMGASAAAPGNGRPDSRMELATAAGTGPVAPRHSVGRHLAFDFSCGPVAQNAAVPNTRDRRSERDVAKFGILRPERHLPASQPFT